jgi:hypothetical protein
MNERLDEIAAELASAGDFREPSAAERASAALRSAGGAAKPKRRPDGPLSRRRKKRLAAELRKPVLLPGQKAPPLPAKPARRRSAAPRPTPDRGYATPTRRGGPARSVIAIAIVALVVAGFLVLRTLQSGTPGASGSTAASSRPTTRSSPASPSPTPLFSTNDPFAGSPAAAYANGTRGIVLPTAHPVGRYTSAQVAAAYRTVKHLLVAAMLNRPTWYGHKPTALGDLLISQQRSWFYDHLTKPYHPKKGPAFRTWRWVTAFASGTEVVGTVVKVHGLPMTAKVVSADDQPVLEIYADYVFVYAVQQPGSAASRLRVVAQEYATVKFAQWNDPDGRLEPWISGFGASYADALCGEPDGLVHPAFPTAGPGQVAPSGAPVDPYDLGQHHTAGNCMRITGT